MPFNSDTAFGGLVGKQNTVHIIGFFIFGKDCVSYFCGFGKVKRDECWRWGHLFSFFFYVYWRIIIIAGIEIFLWIPQLILSYIYGLVMTSFSNISLAHLNIIGFTTLKILYYDLGYI